MMEIIRQSDLVMVKVRVRVRIGVTAKKATGKRGV
jgi:hypothetical protein